MPKKCSVFNRTLIYLFIFLQDPIYFLWRKKESERNKAGIRNQSRKNEKANKKQK